MPWTCPKCGLQLGRRTPGHSFPDSKITYRCPVCRLEMKFDPVTQKMKPVPPEKPSAA
jgi:rubredoxin